MSNVVDTICMRTVQQGAVIITVHDLSTGNPNYASAVRQIRQVLSLSGLVSNFHRHHQYSISNLQEASKLTVTLLILIFLCPVALFIFSKYSTVYHYLNQQGKERTIWLQPTQPGCSQC